MNKYKLAMALFIVTEGTFFALLILAYAYFRAASGSAAAPVLDWRTTGLYSLCLFASSATTVMAGRSLRQGRLANLRLWLAATVLLGAAFLYGQGREYMHLFHRQVTIGSGLFGTTFFTLTGFHGLHVALGLAALAILLGLSFAPGFARTSGPAVETVSLYWHFVDVVWVVIFTIVYLWVAP